jgi:diguanylate cyclase (GGDEF)-like protein
MVEKTSDHTVAQQQLAATQEVLRASEQRYRAAFETSLDAIAICRMDDGMFVDVNQQFFSILGYEREELVGQTSEELYTWTDSDGENHCGEFVDVAGRSSRELDIWENPHDWELLTGILRHESVCRNLEVRLRKKDGTLIWARISASMIELDAVPCVLFVTRDISAAKAAEQEIRNLSLYDGLTRLPNRRQLLERLHAFRNSPAEHTRSALLSINLDHFRALNDSLGSAFGDLFLQESARRIARCVREGDIVARSSGDEFSVILENLGETTEEAAAQARNIAQRTLAALSQPFPLAGQEWRCTASIGITVFAGPDNTAEEILQQSDIAIDHARTAGRNTVRFFAPALQTAINERVAIEADLRTAIESNQLTLFYQPQVRRGQLAGAEALLRWRHPRRGLLLPAEFIPLAEENGLTLPLGAGVGAAACRQAAAWARFPGMAGISIAVNISARQFRQPDFVGKVLDTLVRTGIRPGTIELELTESLLVDDVDQVVARMSELRAHGLRFSVDDFGVGYSSLSYLKRLPLDTLKIDMSFIKDILVDPGSSAIAQAIISLAHAMDLKVIAEGVESEEQRDYLDRLGCHSCQGYFFGEPVPAAQFEQRMAGPYVPKP